MYLSDLIRPLVDKELKEKCIGHKVTISDYFKNDEIICKDVKFIDDDGNCAIKFIDINDKEYLAIGQGIDIWFKID